MPKTNRECQWGDYCKCVSQKSVVYEGVSHAKRVGSRYTGGLPSRGQNVAMPIPNETQR